MAPEKLLSDAIFEAANGVAGGLPVILAFMTAFVVVGQALLLVRRARAQDHARAGRPASSGAAVAAD